jgi:phage terminase large subunit
MPPRILLDPSALNSVYVPHLLNNHQTQIYFGGSSSGKSVFLAKRDALDVLQGRNILVARNVAKTLRGSCWNEIVKAISEMSLSKYFDIGKSDMVITAKNNGAQILFAGLDDVEKVKSITPANGALTDIRIEEATEIEREDYKQLEKRVRGISKHIKRITLSFNPIYKTHWIYTEFFGIWDDSKAYVENESLSILKTTYKDNRFLTADDRARLENEKDPYYYDVYTLGNWGVLGDLIFRNWHTDNLTDFAKTVASPLYGLDFGFSSDPCGAVKVYLDKARKRIYILDELYERGLTNTALAAELKKFCGVSYITCDSSEPKSIEELRQNGINALGAKKGPDSVNHGIQWLQGYEIIVDTRCQNIKNELSMYQWRKDKDGNSLRVPEDKNNHLIDALRYALEHESTARYATTFSRAGLGI